MSEPKGFRSLRVFQFHFKTGLTYRTREAVFFPYWIAETGQRLMHPQHLRHLLFVQAGRPPTISIAPDGQIEAHFPQPTHFSSARNAFVLMQA